MSGAEIFERFNRPLLELIASAREEDWPEVADIAALLHVKLMLRRQGTDPNAPEPRVGDHSIPTLDVPRQALQTAHDAFVKLEAPELAEQVQAVIVGMLERWPVYPPGMDDPEDWK